MPQSRTKRIRRAAARIRRKHRNGSRRTHKVNTHHRFNKS